MGECCLLVITKNQNPDGYRKHTKLKTLKQYLARERGCSQRVPEISTASVTFVFKKKKRQRANSEGVLFYLCVNVCLDVFQMFEEQPGPGTNKRRKRRHPLLLRAHHTPGGLLGLRVTTT